MSIISAPDFDAPVSPLSLLKPIQPNHMVFLHRGQTRLELANALSGIVDARLRQSSRIWLLISEAEVMFIFIVCAVMLYKKRALGKLWIFTKRGSIHGTFLVGNAVYDLVLGVTLYLIAWSITAMVIIVCSFLRTSLMEWWWVIPLTWLPLVLGAYISVHGFAVGCSPRSPLSTVNPEKNAARNRWYYLPIVKNAAIVNTALILPCGLFCSSTVALVGMSGHAYYHAKAFARNMLAPELWLQFERNSAGMPSLLADGDALASDELVWLARTVAANYMQSYRYVSLNLCVFAAAAFALYIPYLIYGIPNIISLVDHACNCYHQPIPASCTTFLRKLWFLLTEGRPRSKQATTSINLGTWKMTILAIIYVGILLICVPGFGWIPVYMVRDTFPHRVIRGDISPVVYVSLMAVSVITVLSCTTVAIFCTVATLDPLFRAAIGLNILRAHIPIDIDVEVHRSRYEDPYGVPELVSPFSMYREKNMLASPQAIKAKSSGRTLTFERSISTLGGSSAKSPMAAEFSDYPLNHDAISSTDDPHHAISSDAGHTVTGHTVTDMVVTVVTKHD